MERMNWTEIPWEYRMLLSEELSVYGGKFGNKINYFQCCLTKPTKIFYEYQPNSLRWQTVIFVFTGSDIFKIILGKKKLSTKDILQALMTNDEILSYYKK